MPKKPKVNEKEDLKELQQTKAKQLAGQKEEEKSKKEKLARKIVEDITKNKC